MSCFKCGKSTNRTIDKVNVCFLRRCSKCISICITSDCKKKSFKDGYCSSHIVIVNVSNEIYKGKNVTNADLERREKKRVEVDDFYNKLDQQRALIGCYREKMSSTDCEGGHKILRKLEDDMSSIIKERNDRIDEVLFKIKEEMVMTFYNDNLGLFERGDYFPGFKSEYQEYKGKFKEYKNHFDQHRRQKSAQEKKKAERTKQRYEERSNRYKEKGYNYDPEEDSDSDDDSNDEPDLDDEETYFTRTNGYALLTESFEVLEIGDEKDYESIRKAYKSMCLKVHPDKHPGEEEIYKIKFFKVSSAYELIMTKMFPNIPM